MAIFERNRKARFALAIAWAGRRDGPYSPKRRTRIAPKRGARRRMRVHTPWGDPDLQGIWSIATITPFERPAALKDKAQLTEPEAAEAGENVSDDPESGSTRRCGDRCRRRACLQRFLVGSRDESGGDASDVARRRSARRPGAGVDTRGTAARGRACEARLRLLAGSQPVGALHHARAADASRSVQQQLSDSPDADSRRRFSTR